MTTSLLYLSVWTKQNLIASTLSAKYMHVNTLGNKRLLFTQGTGAAATTLLRLLECRERKSGRLFTSYANDEQEAETYTNEYLMLHSELSRVSLSEKPDGFIFFSFHRSGTLVCKE